jgi:hypothetical protein
MLPTASAILCTAPVPVIAGERGIMPPTRMTVVQAIPRYAWAIG